MLFLRGAMTPTRFFFPFDWFETHMFAACRPIESDGEKNRDLFCLLRCADELDCCSAEIRRTGGLKAPF